MSDNDLIEISSISYEQTSFFSSSNSLMGFSIDSSPRSLHIKPQIHNENTTDPSIYNFVNSFLSSKLNAFQIPTDSSFETLN